MTDANPSAAAPAAADDAANIIATYPVEAIVEAAKIVPTKWTKAQWGTALTIVTTLGVYLSTMLPSPWDGVVTAVVGVIGVIATAAGIIIPTNKAKV